MDFVRSYFDTNEPLTFLQNPQTTNAPTFLTHIIFAIGGVFQYVSMR